MLGSVHQDEDLKRNPLTNGKAVEFFKRWRDIITLVSTLEGQASSNILDTFELDSKIGQSNIILNYNNKADIPLLILHDTTPDEVKNLLMSISDSKATADDRNPIRFLKMVPNLISNKLTHIINTSIRTNKIPAEWKVATNTPPPPPI